VILARVERLAEEVGRLRRTLRATAGGPETYSSFLADRVAEQVETLHAMVSRSAGDIYDELALTAPGQEAVHAALAASDSASERVRDLLGQDRL
jgi:hypothetical protein